MEIIIGIVIGIVIGLVIACLVGMWWLTGFIDGWR